MASDAFDKYLSEINEAYLRGLKARVEEPVGKREMP